MGTISKHNRKISFLPISSQLRNALAYILLTAVALFFLNLYASSTIRDMVFRAQQHSMQDKAQRMSNTLLQLDELSASKAKQAVSSIEALHTTRAVITDAQGYALYDSLEKGNAEEKLLLFPELVSALRGDDVFYCCYAKDAIESRVAIPLMRDGKILGTVYLMDYDSDQGALVSALQVNILRISAALEGGIILFSLFFSTAFSRRLKHILRSVRKMRDGDYSQKITLRGHDELNRLGAEFNELAERLNASEQVRRQFVSDASHELKTPLATIKLLSDSILQNEMDAETQREFIDDIGHEADRLGRLTQKLLMLTKLDSAAQEEREIIDISPIVTKVLRMLRPHADLRSIRIDCSCEEDCITMTREDDLYQILFNLVENAIKYNRENGWIGLTVRKNGEDLQIVISDNGVGIPEDALPHIFERFYRVDKARSRAAGGSGLGLSIVHDMVLRNYGSITAAARNGGGSVFTVTFPLFSLEDIE